MANRIETLALAAANWYRRRYLSYVSEAGLVDHLRNSKGAPCDPKWAETGAGFLDHEPGEDEDWEADHEAHWLLAHFVTFVLTEWVKEHALLLVIHESSNPEKVAENATNAFVAAWADAREGR